jgi:hypothetical protein
MSQLKYDLAEFVISNRDEIVHYLNEETDHLKYAERLFEKFPEVYDELLNKHRMSKLCHYLAKHFHEPMDNICLIVDPEFIKMTLEY